MTSEETISRSAEMESTPTSINSFPETTTVSTIAIQSGKTRAVIAVLQSGHFINLRILEITPKLARIARNASSSEEMLKQHEEVLEKLKGKQTPVEEMLLQADKVGPTKNPEVYKAMAASLGNAWKDVNATLDFRNQILKKTFEFHTNRTNCLQLFTKVCQDKKLVLVTYRYAVEDGRRLIDKLKRVVQDEPEEASYSIGLIHIWLDELQDARQLWLKNIKSIDNKQRQNLIANEYERIIQDIDGKFQSGHDPLEIRNTLLHLSASVDRSETTDSKKLHLQNIIFNLMERVTIVMELEEEIRAFLKANTILAEPTFKHAYEDKLKLIDTFELKNIDELKRRLEKRLEARKNFEIILEHPFDYEDEVVEKLLNLDSELDTSLAIAQIQAARKGSQKSLLEYFETEMKEVESRYTNLGTATEKESEISILKGKLKNMEEALHNLQQEDQGLPIKSTLLAKCQHFGELLNRSEAVAKFLNANNILDASGFKNRYAAMLSSDLCCQSEVPNPLRECVATRYEIQEKFDAMVENPTAFSEGHIQTICNWDPTLDTTAAYDKLRLLRQKANENRQNQNSEMKPQLLEQKPEILNEIEEQIVLGNSYGLEGNYVQKQSDEQQDSEQKLAEFQNTEENFKRQLAEAIQLEQAERLQRQQAEELNRQQSEELKRQVEELKRVETEKLNQQAGELQRQQADELKRQQSEDLKKQTEELKRQAEELKRQEAVKLNQQADELKRQQAEELKRQAEELKRQQGESLQQQADELKRQQAEELKRQAEELKRQQAESLQQQADELKRQQAAELKRQVTELKQQQAEELSRQQAEALRRQQAEDLKRQEADELKQQQAEALKRQVDELKRQQAEVLMQQAEQMKRQQDAELKQQQAEALQRQLAEEELKRQQAEKVLRQQKEELEQYQKALELQRQKEIDDRRRNLEEHERQMKIEQNQELKHLQKQKAEAERLCQLLEIERQKVESERLQQLMEVEHQKAAEEERQRQLEEYERRISSERQKHLEELEQQKIEAEERRRLEEIEWQRLRDVELQRQIQVQAEIDRLKQLKTSNSERERQNKQLEEQLRLELELKRQELKTLDAQRHAALELQRQKTEMEKERQIDIEKQRKLEEEKRQELEEQRRQALELQREREAQIQQQLQAQLKEHQRFEAEQKKKDMEYEVLEARKLREQHLEHLFKTLDFPLPENLETARSDLRDFQKFEEIVEEMDNPPLELIEKMYEKKNKIIQCLHFYELITKEDRVLYIREIMELEHKLFQSTTISEVIRQEAQLLSINIDQKSRHAANVSAPTETKGYALPSGDYFSTVSDHEVQTIFEQSTMQTQTSERDAKIIANCETQTMTMDAPEPTVLVMQEPAKLLATIQTQTPTLVENEMKEKAIQSDAVENAIFSNLDQLRPESPAKLLLTSETQTSVKTESPEFFSKNKSYTHNESRMIYETSATEQPCASKPLLDSITQTHESSPQFLRNFSTQTNISGEMQDPRQTELKPESKILWQSVAPFEAQRSEERRPSVLELVNALNSQIKLENTAAANYNTSSRCLSNEWKESRPMSTDTGTNGQTPVEPNGPQPQSVVTTTKRFFDNYEEVVTTRVDYPRDAVPTNMPEVSTDVCSDNQIESSYATFPRKNKVKDYKKLFETSKEEGRSQDQSQQPRNVPIQVEFPAKGKVGQFRQLFENADDVVPPVYRISSVRETAKYDSVSRNYQSNYSEHVSCHGVDSPISSACSPHSHIHAAFQESRPESAASNYAGIRKPTKFVPAKFTESDYESDYESFKIEPIWIPPSSRQSRPMSAYEFRPTSFSTNGSEGEPRPKSTNLEKPVPPPKPIAKPIAKKPVPPPKPTRKNQQSDSETGKVTTDEMCFKEAESISDTLQKHKQLTTTMTKTEECKFYLRPIESPIEHDEDLQVRRSVSPTKYVSVTSMPIHFIRARTDSPPIGKFYNKETFREERSWKSFDREKPESFEFGHYSKHLESTSTSEPGTERPQSAVFHKYDFPKSSDVLHANASFPKENKQTEDVSKVHQEIKIGKEDDITTKVNIDF